MAHNYLRFEENDSDEYGDTTNQILKFSQDNSSIEKYQKYDANIHTLTSSYKAEGSQHDSSSQKYKMNKDKYDDRYNYEQHHNDDNDNENLNSDNIREKDSIYGIFEGGFNNEKYFNYKKPLKSSMRDASGERINYSKNNKTVSFKEQMSRNQSAQNISLGKNNTSNVDDQNALFAKQSATVLYNQMDSQVSLSPFERSMANYKATKQRILDAEFNRINDRKQELKKMKEEREQRNSEIRSFLNSQNISTMKTTQFVDQSQLNEKPNAMSMFNPVKKSPEILNLDVKEFDESKCIALVI